MNYFELYPGDYRRDTARLSLAEHGAYLLLMADYYGSETPLPADFDALNRIVGAQGKAEQQAVKTVAERYFPIAPDGMRHNGRADREIEKSQARINAARENGKRGGRPKNNPVGFEEKPSGFPLGSNPVTKNKTQKKAHQTPQAIIGTVTSSSSGDSIPRATPPPDDDERDLAGIEGIPEAVNRETLAQFVRHRRVLRKPVSIAGWLQLRQRLIALIEQGHDPNESLRQTMAAGLAIPVTPRPPATAGPSSPSKTRSATETLLARTTTHGHLAQRRNQPGLGEAAPAAPRRIAAR